MALFNLTPSNNAPRGTSKSLKLILGVGVLAAVIGLGSTLAASIALNTGAPIEFGQGVAQTTSCDGDITVTPISAFVNADAGGAFALSTITLSGINSDGETSCAGKDFIVKAYGKTSSDVLNLFDSVNSILITDTGSTFTIENTSGVTITSDANTTFTLTFDPTHTPVTAGDVYRITIESRDSTPCALGGVCRVGDVGPGGGKIFFVKSLGVFHREYTESGDCEMMDMCQTFSVDLSEAEQAALPYRYLEAKATGNDLVPWSSTRRQTTDGTPVDFGYGQQNTSNIIGEFPSDMSLDNAAVYANNFTTNLKDDWFLPSYNELLLLMLLNANASIKEPNFGSIGHNYWSSTSFDRYNSESSGPTQMRGDVNLLSALNILVVRSIN